MQHNYLGYVFEQGDDDVLHLLLLGDDARPGGIEGVDEGRHVLVPLHQQLVLRHLQCSAQWIHCSESRHVERIKMQQRW